MPGYGSLPGLVSTTITPRKILISEALSVFGEQIVMDSGNTDASASPTHRLRPGNVLILRTSTGRYVEANDTNADAKTAPTAHSTTTHVDGNGVIAVMGNHGLISVTTTTGAGTEANNATDLNADAAFAAHYIASSAAGELIITARRGGADEWMYIDSTTMATAPFTEGVAGVTVGADPDVRVVTEAGDLQDHDGTAQHAPAVNLMRGHFDQSQLINLTGAALEVLVRRGSVMG
jgi:hypothetical protein